MIKYENIEFSTIISQEMIKNKLEKIIGSNSISNKNYYTKDLTGSINLNGFTIHNKIPISLYRGIRHWRVLIKGAMINDNNLTVLKIGIRIFHAEIFDMYFFYIISLIIFIHLGIKPLISAIIFLVVFILITLKTISKCKDINKEINYYKRLIIKTIIE